MLLKNLPRTWVTVRTAMFPLMKPKRRRIPRRTPIQPAVCSRVVYLNCALEEWAARIARGLRRALGVAVVIASAPYELGLPKPVKVGPTHVLRPSKGGIFSPGLGAKAVGTVVAGGTVLGRLLDPVTMETVKIFEAPYPETAVLLLRPMLVVVGGER